MDKKLRLPPLAGPVFFVLTMVGIFLAPAPDLGAPLGEERDWLASVSSERLDLSVALGILALGALLVFGQAVLGRLRPSTARATARDLLVVAITVHLAAYAVLAATGVRGAEASASSASLINDVAMSLHWAAEAAYAGFLGLAGAVALREGAMPRWLATIAVLTSVGVAVSLPFAAADWVHIPATIGGLWSVVAGFVLASSPGVRTGSREVSTTVR